MSCVMATLTHDTRVVAVRRARVGLAFAVLAAASFGLSGALARRPAGRRLVACRAGALPDSRSARSRCWSRPLLALRGRWHLLRANAGLPAGLRCWSRCRRASSPTSTRSTAFRWPIAILIEYAAPVAVVGWLWARHRQTPARLTVTGAAVAIAGLLLVLDVFSVGSVDGLGVLWALGGMVGCAFFFVVSAGEDNGLPPIVLAAGGLVVGSVALGLAGARRAGRHARRRPRDATYNGVAVPWWLPVLALGVVTAGVAYVAGILAEPAPSGARLASFVALLEVLFSVVFAWLLLGQLPERGPAARRCCCSSPG